jgi:hypothetical protein
MTLVSNSTSVHVLISDASLLLMVQVGLLLTDQSCSWRGQREAPRGRMPKCSRYLSTTVLRRDCPTVHPEI